MYVLKLNGKSHTVTIGENGKKKYDPPLPRSRKKVWDKNIEEICDTQTSPGLRTDTTWHTGRGTLMSQMDGDEVYCKYLAEKAAKQGYTVGANDVYIGQMADKDGDPKAFFKPGEGLAELRKRAKKSGKGIDMPGLYVAPKPYEEKPTKALNPNIAATFAREYRATGEANGMSDKQLQQHIIKKHSRHKDLPASTK